MNLKLNLLINIWLYQKEKYPKDAKENAGQMLQERPRFLIWENAVIAASRKNPICCAQTAKNIKDLFTLFLFLNLAYS